VKAIWLAIAIAAAASRLNGLEAQDVAARLEGRVPPNVARAVQGIAQDAQARGLPVEPLIQKAIEGGAKGVPADRVIAAVQQLSARLDEARSALRDAGIQQPTAEALESGAYGLSAGLNARQVRDLGRLSQPPYDPALTLRVAATLAALGVPPQRGLQLMEHMIKAGRGPSDLLDLPSEVQVEMGRGASATEAVEELDTGRRGKDERSERGQHGQHGEEGGPTRKP
jgi:hypothetical protein